MHHLSADYYCSYHSVAYWVFRRELDTGAFEPIIEVESMEDGHAISDWLRHNQYIGQMMVCHANDN